MFDFTYHPNFHTWVVSAISPGAESKLDAHAVMNFSFSFDNGLGDVYPISQESVYQLLACIIEFFNANNPNDPITADEVTVRQRWTKEDVHKLGEFNAN